MESRTQGSRPRPRTQKNFEAKAKDRPSRGQGQRRKCSPKKRSSKFFFRRSQKKSLQIFISDEKGLQKYFFRQSPREENKKMSSKIFREISGVFQQNFNSSKSSAVLEPGQGNFRELEASRPRPRTSKCVLEDVLKDSTSAIYFSQ